MILETIATDQAPQAIGPYSQAVKAGGFLYCSGQIAMAPGGTDFQEGECGDQARQVLSNLRAVLAAGGSSLERVVKTTVYLTTMDHFPVVNEIYAEFFGDARPARATVAVSGLPKNALVEIEAIALA